MIMRSTAGLRLTVAVALTRIDETLNRQRGKRWPGYPLARRAPRSFRLYRALNRAIEVILPEVLGPFEDDEPMCCAA